MKQSALFFKTSKNISKDEKSLNAQLLIRASFIDKLMAGVYTILPLGFRVLKKIEQVIREEMNAIGGQEIFMPTLQPKENWQKTGRWEDLDVLFKTKLSNEKEAALGPTHEEVISPLAKKFVASYKDLPFYLYHIQNKFRNEKRAKSGILRTREFIMKDLYSFHTNEKDLKRYYEKVMEAYGKIFARCGIDKVTYLTYASGGTFSKYSHEYQTLTESGEDLIYVCEKCRVAINREILDDQQNKCPRCGSEDLKEEKAVEVGNIFKLGSKFSDPFKLTYKDKNGTEKPVVMGCYGIGLQRLMGTIVEVLYDEKGIVWPRSVAPFDVHLLELSGDNEKVSQSTQGLYEELKKSGIEVLYDDRKNIAAGEKFADADLIGCPYRIVVSEKTIKNDKFELKKRDEAEEKMLSKEALLKVLK